jgi:hypothetical protein
MGVGVQDGKEVADFSFSASEAVNLGGDGRQQAVGVVKATVLPVEGEPGPGLLAGEVRLCCGYRPATDAGQDQFMPKRLVRRQLFF